MSGAPDRVVLLIGSPKAAGSTSESLGRYLLGRMEGKGCSSETFSLPASLRTEERRADLLSAVRRADLWILASPLYSDSFPWGVTRFFELAGSARTPGTGAGAARLALLINCGFPEARQCETALAIARCFARETGMGWAGGLALGGGESIGGRPLEAAGGVAKKVRTSLDQAAAALCAGKEIPPEAVSRMAEPMMPLWVYTGIGNLGWRIRARRHGASGRLNARPYLP